MLDAIITAGKLCNLTLQSRLTVVDAHAIAILSDEFQHTLWGGRSCHMTHSTFTVPYCLKVLHPYFL
jgi:hypothetical protein